MKIKITIVLTCIIICYSFSTQQKIEFSKTEWLVGTWENKTSQGSMYETWTRVSDVELQGKSYMIKDTDTMVFETIRLVLEAENLFYIPTVENQNNKQPVRFAMTNLTDSLMVFENPKHDFPQVISYKRTGSHSLTAEISATKKGKERKQTFPMVRVD